MLNQETLKKFFKRIKQDVDKTEGVGETIKITIKNLNDLITILPNTKEDDPDEARQLIYTLQNKAERAKLAKRVASEKLSKSINKMFKQETFEKLNKYVIEYTKSEKQELNNKTIRLFLIVVCYISITLLILADQLDNEQKEIISKLRSLMEAINDSLVKSNMISKDDDKNKLAESEEFKSVTILLMKYTEKIKNTILASSKE